MFTELNQIEWFNWIGLYKINAQLIYVLYWFKDIFILKYSDLVEWKFQVIWNNL